MKPLSTFLPLAHLRSWCGLMPMPDSRTHASQLGRPGIVLSTQPASLTGSSRVKTCARQDLTGVEPGK
jgi:hypothetical protein